jgi:acetyl-CoA acetyltransferase
MDNGNGGFGGREVVIVEAVRTPIGRGHPEKGYYKDLHPSNLLARTYKELIERGGIDPNEVGDVIAGCVQQFGEQGLNIGRNAWLEAGLPQEVPATTVDRQCGSAQQAVNFAAALVASGVHDVAIGGGVEHMGHISFADSFSVMQEHGMAFSPKLMERYDLIPQGLSAEMIADKWEISRSELDEIGLRSQRLAAQATEEGRFEREIVPMQVNGDTYVTDQGLRETTIEGLSQLKPAFKEDGKITAGNSSQVSAGADLRPDHRRRRPGDHADRPDPRHPEAAGAQRDDDGRHRPGRDQRGLRLRPRRLAAGARSRHGPRQRQRRRDRPRSPARLDRRPPDHHPAARDGALRQGDGPGDDVLRGRPRHRHLDSAALKRLWFPPITQMCFRRGRILAVTALALMLALAGCGGDEDATSAGGDGGIPTSSLTKAQFLKKGNAICAEIYSEITEKYEAFYEAEKRTEAELDNKAAEVVTPNVVKLEKRLEALGAPQGQERKVEAILTALEEGVERAEEDVSTTRGAHGEFAFEKPYKLMWAYGLKRCGLDG